MDGLSFIGAEYLLPLKVRAWLDLSERKKQGKAIDSKTIKKHKNDVFRLFQILNPDFNGDVPDKIKNDLGEFVSLMKTESIDLKKKNQEQAKKLFLQAIEYLEKAQSAKEGDKRFNYIMAYALLHTDQLDQAASGDLAQQSQTVVADDILK